ICWRPPRASPGPGQDCVMTGPVFASGRDLRALAAIVSADRGEPPAGGVPPSLLSDLLGLVRRDHLIFVGADSSRQVNWFSQVAPAEAGDGWDHVAEFWEHYWSSSAASYRDRSGDLRSVIKISDFYSPRQWHSTGLYHDACRPDGIEHQLMLCLPAGDGRARAVRRARADRAAGLRPRARPGLLRARPRPAHRTAPARVSGLPRRRAPPPPCPAAHRPALGPAASGCRRAHQRPDRPPPGHIRGNRAHAPGTHLPPAAGLQPARRRHPRLRRPQRPDTPRSQARAAARPAACSPTWPEPSARCTGLSLHSPLMICRLWRGWATTQNA